MFVRLQDDKVYVENRLEEFSGLFEEAEQSEVVPSFVESNEIEVKVPEKRGDKNDAKRHHKAPGDRG